MEPLSILLTGANGLLGPYLHAELSRKGQVTRVSRSSGDVLCDLTNLDAVQSLFKANQPDVVIHAAAMTDVDACENSPDKAIAVNATAVSNLAQAMPAQAKLVLISTDQVYPDTPGPHVETETGPVNVYGASKFAGEHAALERPNSLVLRCNFFGPSLTPGRKSLSDWLIGALRAGDRITLFEDVLFSPLHIQTLSQLVATMTFKNSNHVYNLGCRDGASKKDFALRIATHLKLNTDHAQTGSSSDIPGFAARPHDLRMDVTRIEEELGFRMPTLDEEIEKL